MIRRFSFHHALLAVNGSQLILLLALGLFPIASWYFKTLGSNEFSNGASSEILPVVAQALVTSLLLALTVGLCATVLAFVMGWWLWRYRLNSTLARAIELGIKVPYLIPAFFFAMGWIALAAPNVGLLNQIASRFGLPAMPNIYGFGGIAFVEICWSCSLASIQLQGFFKNYSSQLEDAALLCGARPWQALLHITWPVARAQLFACFLLNLAANLAAFGVPALLGLPARSYVATTRIFQSVKSGGGFSQVAILAAALMVLTIIVVVIYTRVANRLAETSIVSGKVSQSNKLRLSLGARLCGGFILLFCLIATVLPLAAVLIQSFLLDRGNLTSWTLAKYQYVFGSLPDGIQASSNSIILATGTAALITFLGLFTAYGHLKSSGPAKTLAEWLGNAWSFFYATPGTIIALPLLVFFQTSIAHSLWIIVLAFALKYSAFAIRTLEPALMQISRDLEEAAWVSGATPGKTFLTIVIPLLFPALSAAFALSLIPMLSELTMSIFLVGAGTETLGTLIYRFQEYADPGAASVLAVSVGSATLLLNSGLRRLSRGGFGI